MKRAAMFSRTTLSVTELALPTSGADLMLYIDFDPAKNRSNVAKHGISLARAAEMQMLAVKIDERFAYGEARYRAWGTIDGKFYCFAFTLRGAGIRAISLRRAHLKEVRENAPESGI